MDKDQAKEKIRQILDIAQLSNEDEAEILEFFLEAAKMRMSEEEDD